MSFATRSSTAVEASLPRPPPQNRQDVNRAKLPPKCFERARLHRLRKNSDSKRVWEGHEFHSCRNRRGINRGFQPLGECGFQTDPLPMVAPVTSTIPGVPSEVVLNEEDGMKSPCAVNLHNAVTYLNRESQQRLGRRVTQLSAARMNEVCAALRFSLGCDAN